MNVTKLTEQITEHTKEYVELELQIAKHRAVKEVGKAVATGFSYMFLLFFGAVILVLGGIWLGFYFSDLFGSSTLGFGASTGVFIVLILVLGALRGVFLEKIFLNAAVRQIYRNHTDED